MTRALLLPFVGLVHVPDELFISPSLAAGGPTLDVVKTRDETAGSERD